MRSGQGGYQLRTFGGKVPIAWLIGTGGWAMFVHTPYGSFDLPGAESKFIPPAPDQAFPLDLFFVTSKDPAIIMGEYARITGHAEMPPLWSFGYQQSHRTLGTPEEILAECKTFREKKLPCDAMIYLGTGFCPNGWNTNNTEFTWNKRAFPLTTITSILRRIISKPWYTSRIPWEFAVSRHGEGCLRSGRCAPNAGICWNMPASATTAIDG
jgi:alpha-glucosidase/alpha-D-xyloside xylohydrolase